MLNIFIGYDRREAVAYHVLCHSIMEHATVPVRITPLIQDTLRKTDAYQREPDTLATTEFSLTRFLVPHLANYSGQALFLDCDMLVQTDLVPLFELANQEYEVPCFVVKHEYTPKTATKMDDQRQTVYPRKNWSSMMLFNCAQCNFLTPEYVNAAAPSELHQFTWAEGRELGSLTKEWNWLVGEYPSNPDAYILHYTLGGPWFGRHDGQESECWLDAYEAMMKGAQHALLSQV